MYDKNKKDIHCQALIDALISLCFCYLCKFLQEKQHHID